MRNCDQVVVLCGTSTHTASGVDHELKIAKEIGKPYFLLRGYSDKICTKPASSTDTMYDWTWPILKALIGGSR
jgi:hypothetical protein